MESSSKAVAQKLAEKANLVPSLHAQMRGSRFVNNKANPGWLALQAAAIVGSILLAFAIDAWWENRQEREIEHAGIVSLHRDFLQSRADLDEALQIFDSWKAYFSQFQSSTAAELRLLDDATVGLIVTSLSPGMTFDPTTGTLEALVGDGRLGLIENSELRDGLASWLRVLADTVENEADIRAGSLRAQLGTEVHGGPFQVPVPGRAVDLAHFLLPTGETLSALRQDPDFVGRVRSHHFQIALYVRELRVVSEILDANLAILEDLINEGE